MTERDRDRQTDRHRETETDRGGDRRRDRGRRAGEIRTKGGGGGGGGQTRSIAIQHLSPNSARIGCATECRGTLNLRAAVHRRCQRPPKGMGWVLVG